MLCDGECFLVGSRHWQTLFPRNFHTHEEFAAREGDHGSLKRSNKLTMAVKLRQQIEQDEYQLRHRINGDALVTRCRAAGSC